VTFCANFSRVSKFAACVKLKTNFFREIVSLGHSAESPRKPAEQQSFNQFAQRKN